MLHFSRHAADDTPEMDITPLLDVVFILLLFFIIAAAFAARAVDLDLPPAQSSQALSGRVVEWRLAEDGSLFCEGLPVPREDVRSTLQKVIRGFRERPGQLVLKPHPKAPAGALLFLVDEVRLQGGEKLLIATQPTGRQDGSGARP